MLARSTVAALLLAAAVPVTAFAQSTRPARANRPAQAAPQGSDYALTIYSTADPATFDPQQLAQQRLYNPYNAWQFKLPGYGVVREVRPIELKEGENIIRFSDVASGIDPTTVAFQSLTAPDQAAVLEQNYEYDVVSASKLLEKYLGKEITISRKASPDVTRPVEDVTGMLLSQDASNIVLQSEAGDATIISRAEVTAIKLARQETGLITKPTLVWKLDADKAGRHDAQVTYQTDGLTWRADYNVVVNATDTAADIGAWVSILNESGASYPNARLKLVAGDVQRVQPPQGVYAGGGMVQQMAKRADVGGFQEKSFFEYHLYTLGRRTSLANNSTKQIELFPSKTNVPVTKTFVYYGLEPQYRLFIAPEPNQDRNLGTQSNKKVDIYLQIKNSEANGLGIPLPAGRLRVYKKDEPTTRPAPAGGADHLPATTHGAAAAAGDGALEFIGEDVIQHTPKDEEVLVKLGSAFDIVGERKQTDFSANYDGHVITEAFEITIRNHKQEAAHVIIKENLLRWTNWEITQSTDKWEKQDYRTIHIPVDVPAGGEKKVRYCVKYTW
jgi:hypothetical protein